LTVFKELANLASSHVFIIVVKNVYIIYLLLVKLFFFFVIIVHTKCTTSDTKMDMMIIVHWLRGSDATL